MEAVSGKKKLRIQTYPDTSRALAAVPSVAVLERVKTVQYYHSFINININIHCDITLLANKILLMIYN